MYEAEQREADMLFTMSSILKTAAEEIKRLALRCDEYARAYDVLLEDFENLERQKKEPNESGQETYAKGA